MKTKIIFVLVFMVLFLTLSNAQAQSGINIVLTSQDPLPVEPGENVEIEIDIQNIGNTEARDFSVTVIPPPTFTLLPGEDDVVSFVNIGAYSSAKQTYRFKVGEQTLTGQYNVKFRVNAGDQITQIEEVSVSVQGNPMIILKHVSLDPEIIEAGGTATLSIEVSNVGTGTARHLSLSLNSTANIIPLLSDSFSYIGDLLPGQTATANMQISIDDSAEEQTYVMDLTAAFNDESNTESSETYDIGIPVTGKVQLDIIKTEPNYARNLLEIEIANKGTSEAKSVESRMYVGDQLIDVDYTSQIKPTKKTTFNFPLLKQGQGRLEITYTGPGLQRNTITHDMVFDYGNANGNGGDNSLTAFLVIIIIIVVVFYFWRRRKKKKKK